MNIDFVWLWPAVFWKHTLNKIGHVNAFSVNLSVQIPDLHSADHRWDRSNPSHQSPGGGQSQPGRGSVPAIFELMG